MFKFILDEVLILNQWLKLLLKKKICKVNI